MSEPTISHTVTSGSLAELNLILARMDDARRAQATPPQKKVIQVEDKYETAVVVNQEQGIDETRGLRQRPQFLIDDDKGWEIPWTW